MSTNLPLELHATERADCVREHTSRQMQADLDHQDLVARLRHYVERRQFDDGQEALTERIAELEQEPDIERTLAANAATLALTGTLLGILHDRRWLAVPMVVTSFLLQHALQGWCPPIAVFRRIGIRTRAEIDAERYALKLLRGDLEVDDRVAADADPEALVHRVLEAVTR